MAKPINITPLLKGKDAVSFLKKIEINSTKRIKVAALREISKDASALRAISK